MSLRVKATYATSLPRILLCESCGREIHAGRVYELSLHAAPALILCGVCRNDFTHADLDLEAEEIAFYRAQQPMESESEDRTNWLHAVQHPTFPPYKG